MGTSIALHAAQRFDALSEPVLLLERASLGAGSSGRSGAILRTQYSERVLAAMARDSLRFYAGFERRTARSIGFIQCGVLTLAGGSNPALREAIERNIAMIASIGVDMRRLDAPAIRALVPRIRVSDDTIGAYEPQAGCVDPQATVEALATLAREQGATTRIGLRAEELWIEGGRVRGVRTEGGAIEAGQVVVAAGPWTGALLERAGLAHHLRIVRPEQHFITMPPCEQGSAQGADSWTPEADLDERFARPPEIPRPAHPIVLDTELGHYFKCEPDRNRTRIGRMDHAMDEELSAPEELEEEVGAAFSGEAREALCRRLPVYRDLPDAGAQAAWYTLTPDSQAVIGPLPEVEGLFVVSGFSGHGFKLAPSVGEGVAQMLAGEPISAFDPEFFSPSRFDGNGPAREHRPFGL
jgi:glycine/D-amino acid oxidase-like deaminating enzyme